MADYKPEEIEACEIVFKTRKGKLSTKRFSGGTAKNIAKATKFYDNTYLSDKNKEGLYKVKVQRVWHVVRSFKHED
jgi:hypothetical protein